MVPVLAFFPFVFLMTDLTVSFFWHSGPFLQFFFFFFFRLLFLPANPDARGFPASPSTFISVCPFCLQRGSLLCSLTKYDFRFFTTASQFIPPQKLSLPLSACSERPLNSVLYMAAFAFEVDYKGQVFLPYLLFFLSCPPLFIDLL